MKLPALALLFALIGCGGGGTDPPRTVQLFGDSTQVQLYPVLAPLVPHLTNSAAGGTRSDMLLHGTDGINKPWPHSISADVVLINHGMNDARPWEKVSLLNYRENIRKLARVPAPVLVVLQTPNPSTYPGRDTAPYAQVMREVAAEMRLPLIDVHACFMRQPDWPARLYDGVHPDPAGLQYIAATCVAPSLLLIVGGP